MGSIDLSALGTSTASGWDVLWAVLAVVVCWIASIFVRRGLYALMRKTPNVSQAMAVFIARVGKYLVILVGIGIGLAFLGVGVQPVLAMTLVVIVVAVLVLRGVADNFSAGVLLQTGHPIEPGDEIQAAGYVGIVTELNGRNVVIKTYDGRTVHVPNASIMSNAIVNNSTGGARRSEVQVRVAREPGTEIERVQQVVTDAAASVSGAPAGADARTLLVTVSPDRITGRVQFWHAPVDGLTVTSDVIGAVSRALEDAKLVGTVTSADADPPLVPPDRV